MNRFEDDSRARALGALAAAVALGLLLWSTQRTLGAALLFLATWLLARALPGSSARGALRSVLALVLLLWILHEARWVVYPLVAGMLTAYVVVPGVDWLVAHRVRRSIAAGIALLPIALLAALAAILLIPALVHQMQLLIDKLPGIYEHVSKWAEQVGRSSGAPSAAPDTTSPSAVLGPPDSTAVALPGAASSPLPSVAAQLIAQAEAVLRAALGGLVGLGKGLGRAAQWLGLLLLTPVVAYHLLVDWDNLRDSVFRWLPDRWHPWTRRVSGELKTSLQVYMRGQLIVAGVEAVLFSLVFLVAGLPQPLALGFLAGLFSLVPILGFWLTLLVVLLNALTGPSPWPSLIKSGVGMLIINILEGQLLVPRIQGTGLGLHPLVVLLGVLLFGTLFGFAGVILAVPVLGVLRAVLPEILSAWRASRSFQGGD